MIRATNAAAVTSKIMQNPGQTCGTPVLCTTWWWKPSITPCPASAKTAIHGLYLNPATAAVMKTAAIAR
jgi:hypothetical protein